MFDRRRTTPPLVYFFTDTSTSHIYTLSLHDALPIFAQATDDRLLALIDEATRSIDRATGWFFAPRLLTVRLRSEEHTSELQSLTNLVCRLLLEKKNCYETGVADGSPGRLGAPGGFEL